MHMVIADYDFLFFHHNRTFRQFEMGQYDAVAIESHWKHDQLLTQRLGDRRVSLEAGSYAAAMLAKVRQRTAIKGRLLLCSTEEGVLHCVTEAASRDESETYIMDRRHSILMTSRTLSHYQFHAASPWCPSAEDARCWLLL